MNHQSVSVKVYLALGSNLGDRQANLARACEELNTRLVLTDQSLIYETEPWGFADQPAFLNQVVAGTTELTPERLLAFTQSIEKKLGRVKTFRNGPRVIDIDILIYGNNVIQTESLVIPHPRMLERGFVLKPLADVAPNLRVIGSNLTINELLESVGQAGITSWSPTTNKGGG